MAHKTLIDSTGYEVKSGRVLIAGTGYDIKKGRTLIDGTGYDISFGVPVGELAVGASVYTDFGGSRTEFIIANQGNPDSSIYDNTAAGTWLLIKNIYEINVKYRQYSASSSLYTDSYLVGIMNEYLEKFPAAIQHTIRTINLPCNGYNGSTVDSLSCKLFPLSVAELEPQNSYISFHDGAVLQLFNNDDHNLKIAYYNNSAKRYWTRSGESQMYGNNIYIINETGWVRSNKTITDGHPEQAGTRFAFLVPTETLVDSDFNIIPS